MVVDKYAENTALQFLIHPGLLRTMQGVKYNTKNGNTLVFLNSTQIHKWYIDAKLNGLIQVKCITKCRIV